MPGTEKNVESVVRWDPDGAGPQPELLVIGGQFATFGTQNIEALAGFDGSSWGQIGDLQGDYLYVNALAVYHGDLIVAGSFSTFAGIPAHSIVRFDGITWHALGEGIAGYVRSLRVVEDDLLVGGVFSMAGGVEANSIARWNGDSESWSAMGDGFVVGQFSGLQGVEDIHVHNEQVIVCGDLSASGDTPVNNIAAWDGAAWQPVGDGQPLPILSLATFGGDLIAGGIDVNFDTFDVNGRVARFDGESWTQMGEILPDAFGNLEGVTSLREFRGQLYAGGDFGFKIDGSSGEIQGLARWDGSAWRAVARGVSGFAVPATGGRRQEEFGGRLIVCGGFGNAGAVAAFNVAAWDGCTWSAFEVGTNFPVTSFLRYHGDLLAGGGFTMIDGVNTSNLARWDGEHWRRFHPQPEGVVFNLATFRGDLIISGDLPGQVARLDRNRWRPLGSGLAGGSAQDFVVYRGELVAGGSFTSAGGVGVNAIAAWNGRSWRPIGGGFTSPQEFLSPVTALAVYRGDLIATGFLTTADGQPVRNIARWDGHHWTELGGGLSGGFVWPGDLLVHDGELIVAGQFDAAGGVPCRNVAAWNGRAWRAVGNDLPYMALSVALVDDQLFAGCLGFNFADAVFAFDGGHWSAVAGGPTNQTQTPLIPQIPALIGYEGDLFAGGGFFHVGETPTAFVARATCCERSAAQPAKAPPLGSNWARLINAETVQILDEQGKVIAEGPFLRRHGAVKCGASGKPAPDLFDTVGFDEPEASGDESLPGQSLPDSLQNH